MVKRREERRGEGSEVCGEKEKHSRYVDAKVGAVLKWGKGSGERELFKGMLVYSTHDATNILLLLNNHLSFSPFLFATSPWKPPLPSHFYA